LCLHANVRDNQRPLPIDEACAGLQSGELDAALIVAGFKPEAVAKVLEEHGDRLRFVSLGTPGGIGGQVDGFLLNYPFASRYLIPRRTYTSGEHVPEGLPRQSIVTLSVRTVLACRRDLPEDLVFDLTQAIVEKRSELIHLHPAAAHITGHLDEATLAFPLHPGARRFMHRHEPGFLVTYAEVMAFGLSLMVATVALLSAFRRWISRRMKNRIDTYYVRLNDLLEKLQKVPEKVKLKEMELELSAMQHQAFQELVDERLVANESFRIFQSLLSDCQRQIHTRLQSE
ncbi:MAG: TAXI family TRAP transporter solute-binding subunit, partial [Verrucomicrobiales bacterium]